MWQIWYHHMRYYSCPFLSCGWTIKAIHFIVEVLTVNQILQHQHGGSETNAALEFAVNSLQVWNCCDITEGTEKTVSGFDTFSFIWSGRKCIGGRSQPMRWHPGTNEYARWFDLWVKPLVISVTCCFGRLLYVLSLNLLIYWCRSFIKNWVSIGKSARLSTKAAAGNLSFEMQCKHCEKVIFFLIIRVMFM